MDTPLHSAEEATSRFLLSRTMQTLLDRSAYSGSIKEPVIDVASFLRTVVGYRSGNTASVVAYEVLESHIALFPEPVGTTDPKRANLHMFVSDGLWQALDEAQKLRQATGGNDDFVGLRYVLFVIFTARDGTLGEEVGLLFKSAEIDQAAAGMAIARYCIEGHEPSEDFSVWARELTARGLEGALASWRGPISADAGATKAPPTDGGVGPESSGDFAPSGVVTAKPAALGSAVALLQPDDPWALKTLDKSGAEQEARAFADMVVAANFRPPFAIGVFGDWGSGKSHFMRLLHESVADNKKRLQAANQPGGVEFCRRVVQIRFNAWHYSEENLWASLVDHIFTSLNEWAVATGTPADEADKLFDQLTSARLLTIEAATTLVESRRQKAEAASNLVKAEDVLRDKQAVVEADPRTFVQSAFNTVVHKTDAKAKLAEAADKLGLTDLGANAKALETASAALTSELDRFAMLRTGMVRQLAAPVIVLLVIALTLVLPPLMSYLTGWMNNPAAQFGAGLAGLIAPLVAALGWAAARTNDALAIVTDYRAQFESEVARLTTEDREKVTARQKEADDAEAAVVAAKASLDSATQAANDAAVAFNSETGGARVLKFVRDRVANGDYAKHLGFVATVRKDFEELSRLLGQTEQVGEKDKLKRPREAELARKAHLNRVTELVLKAGPLLEPEEAKMLEDTTAEKGDAPKAFQRVILYVDDLDRCQPKQVIAVLQAIHLLLTFPLFVVFVAVDVRWLRHALKKRYPDQLDDGAGDMATTSDYLEKVFQIPYWVRPFGPTVTQALLADRIDPPAVAEEPPLDPVPPDPASPAAAEGADAAATPPVQGADPATTIAPPPVEGAGATASPPPQAEGADPAAAVPSPDPVPPTGDQPTAEPPPRPLSLTTQERKCIDKIAVKLDGLPRRTLRFINTYWIIKGGLKREDQDLLEDSGYPALLALLAMAITLDDDYPLLAKAIDADEDGKTPIEDILSGITTFAQPEVTLKQMRACLTAVGNPETDRLRPYASLVARYSFHRGLSI